MSNEPVSQRRNFRAILKDYGILALATLLLDIGVYFFKFTNNFSFGGVNTSLVFRRGDLV